MSLSIKEEEQLSDKVKEFPVLYDKAAKGYKEKDAVNNAWIKWWYSPSSSLFLKIFRTQNFGGLRRIFFLHLLFRSFLKFRSRNNSNSKFSSKNSSSMLMHFLGLKLLLLTWMAENNVYALSKTWAWVSKTSKEAQYFS